MKMPRLRFSILAMLILIGVVSMVLAYWQQTLAWESAQQRFQKIVIEGKNVRPTAQQIESIERYIRNYPELSLREGAVVWATHYGTTELVRNMLAAGANPNKDEDDGLVFPIHHAVQRNLLEMVEALIDAGADIEARGIHRVTNVQDVTPLHVSALDGNIRMCDLLLKRGADLEAVYGKPRPDSTWSPRTSDWVNSTSASNTVLHAAVIGGDPETVEFLLDQGAVSVASNQLVTPYDIAQYIRRRYEDDETQAQAYDEIIALLETKTDVVSGP